MRLQFMYRTQIFVQNNLEFGIVYVVTKVFGGPKNSQSVQFIGWLFVF